MVEGARLESVFRGNSNEGSNPSLSAIYFRRLKPNILREAWVLDTRKKSTSLGQEMGALPY